MRTFRLGEISVSAVIDRLVWRLCLWTVCLIIVPEIHGVLNDHNWFPAHRSFRACVASCTAAVGGLVHDWLALMSSAGRTRPRGSRGGRYVLQRMTPERLRLDEALLQDFLDGLPDPIGVSDLAELLTVSRAVILGRLRRGALQGQKNGSHWLVGVETNRDWIASHRRPTTRNGGSPSAPSGVVVPVFIDDPDLLVELRELVSTGLSAAGAVRMLLRGHTSDQGTSTVRKRAVRVEVEATI